MALLKAGKLEPKREHKDLEVPELGGSVRVQQLSYGDQTRLQKVRKEQMGPEDVRAVNLFIVQKALITEEGKPLFPDEKAANDFLDQVTVKTVVELGRIITDFEKRPESSEPGKSEGTPPSSGA